MKIKKEASPLSQEQRILECIDNERRLVVYYRALLHEIGPDGVAVVKTLLVDHERHIDLLEQLLVEIQELRELSLAMAD